MSLAAPLSTLSLAIWLYLLAGRGGFWRLRAAPPAPPGSEAPEVVAVVPARDEAATVGAAVTSLLRQDYGGRFSVILVDDHSRDGTAAAAMRAAAECGAAERLAVVRARPLPPGWTGKLWALAEGLRHAAATAPMAELVLLTDADIAHDPTGLAQLVARLQAQHLDMASLMVRLSCRSPAERALVPAFVFFFAMLYPFAWANDPRRRTAAAAGGCILLRQSALARIGGLERIRGELIDDCALAREVKRGGRIWIGLAESTRSIRPYPRVADIWRMIARTAYTQLDHSPVLLAGTALAMAVTYLAPPILVFAGGPASWFAGAAWIAMAVALQPILRYYGRSPGWGALLPGIALVYLGATIDSARRHWQGRGGAWKGRVQRLRGPA
jgi:hopene-associated glycosyltransferase HpnB